MAKRQMDTYLTEVYKSFIAIKDEEYQKSLKVFESVFREVKATMGKQSEYFAHYCTQVMYAGSVYDKIKITKLDEFDMDLIIRLPTKNNKNIIVEPDKPGFVRLKFGKPFDELDSQKHWDNCHETLRHWKDDDGFLLQNKFRYWIQSIVQRSLNDLNYQVVVDGSAFHVTYKEKGPAYTLLIESEVGNPEIKFEVDLVPVLKFPYNNKWPDKLFRKVKLPDNFRADWHAVPKPNKATSEKSVKNRTWRISFQEIERFMMKNQQHMKPTIKLVKKLRDNLGMDEISSYYIKTLFLWKLHEEDTSYWDRSLSEVFRAMVEDLYNCVREKRIRFFWQQDNNLIEHVPTGVLAEYAEKLASVIGCLYYLDAKRIVTFLLTPEELESFESSPFYQQQARLNPFQTILDSSSSELNTNDYTNVINLLDTLKEKINSANEKTNVRNELVQLAKELNRLNLLNRPIVQIYGSSESDSNKPRVLSIDDEIENSSSCQEGHENLVCFETQYQNEWQNELCGSTTNLFLGDVYSSNYSTASENENDKLPNKPNIKSTIPIKKLFSWKKVFSSKSRGREKVCVRDTVETEHVQHERDRQHISKASQNSINK